MLGKRMLYIPPVRLYLIISLVYFTLLSFVNNEIFKFTESSKEEDQKVIFGLDPQDTVVLDLGEVKDSLKVEKRDTSQVESKTQQILKK